MHGVVVPSAHPILWAIAASPIIMVLQYLATHHTHPHHDVSTVHPLASHDPIYREYGVYGYVGIRGTCHDSMPYMM